MRGMFRIAVCDDSRWDADKVKAIVQGWLDESWDGDGEVDVYESSSKLLESHRLERYDLLILDVLMPEQTGIELARSLRRGGDETMVIYASSTTEYAMDAFGIQALGYVPKPVDREVLTALLARARVLYDAKPKKWLTIKGSDGPAKIELMDIVYVENINRAAVYVLRDDRRIEVSRRSGTFEEMVDPVSSERAFVQIHKSFFVNMRYIKSLQDESVVLDGGTELPVARRRKAELKDRYMNYIFDGGTQA